MPSLQRYVQQSSPSGRVGPLQVDPEALTRQGDSGAGLPWRGVEAAGAALAGTADVFTKVQDMEDEIAVSTARRQAGEHMASLWNDIQNEPDWTKHQALYDKAYSTASGFAPKGGSVNAGREYQAFLDQMKPHWDSQFLANQTRRRILTIDSDTQANLALDAERCLKAIEQGDWSGELLAEWGIDSTLKTRVENGLSTQPQADLIRAQMREKADTAHVWYDAMGVMGLSGIAEAEKVVMESALLDEQKVSIIHNLRFHDQSAQIARSRATKEEMDASETRISLAFSDALDSGDFDAARAALDNERSIFETAGQGPQFLKWRTMLDEMVDSVNKESKWEGRQNPEVFANLIVDISNDPDSVTNEEIDGWTLEGVISPQQLIQLKGMKVKDKQLSPLARAMQSELLQRLDRIYQSGKDATPKNLKGYAERIVQTGLFGLDWTKKDAVTPVEPQFNTYLGLVGAVSKWYTDHPDASVEEYTEFGNKIAAVRTQEQAAAFNAGIAGYEPTTETQAQTRVVSGFTACPDRSLAPFWTQLTDNEKAKAIEAIGRKTIPMSDIAKAAKESILKRTKPDASTGK